MESKLYDLLVDIEEFLITYIDSVKDYESYEDVEDFMISQSPEIQALYQSYVALTEKYFPIEE